MAVPKGTNRCEYRPCASGALNRLEPDERKPSCPVPRGGGPGATRPPYPTVTTHYVQTARPECNRKVERRTGGGVDSGLVGPLTPCQNGSGVPIASVRTQPILRALAKGKVRLLAAPQVPAPTSERTLPHEGPSNRPMGRRALATRTPQREGKEMKPWTEQTHYGALDWARDHHDVVVVDRNGEIVADFRIDHTLEGWNQLRAHLTPYPGLAIAVETNQGPAVEQLVAAGFTLYPVNPRSAKAYRDRKAPTGAKSDRLDAWSLADALRVDGHRWRPLAPEDPLVVELRQLCRDEVSLIEQRTAFLAQLRYTLHGYYPAALEAFPDWTYPSSWEFLIEFPTPADLAAAGPRKWKRWLLAHKLHFPGPNERRFEIFARATRFQGSPATVAAKSLLAVSLARLLRTLEAQLVQYRARIQELFEKHPDHDLFGSLPGAGPKLAPRLLSEMGDNRSRFESAEVLQCYAGTAPISFQSGQIDRTYMRRACNLELRQAVHLWASLSMRKSAWAYAYYLKHRRDGQSHACALRCLGQRWLKILWKMWQTRTPYDLEFHQRNQVKHGSWVLELQPSATP